MAVCCAAQWFWFNNLQIITDQCKRQNSHFKASHLNRCWSWNLQLHSSSKSLFSSERAFSSSRKLDLAVWSSARSDYSTCLPACLKWMIRRSILDSLKYIHDFTQGFLLGKISVIMYQVQNKLGTPGLGFRKVSLVWPEPFQFLGRNGVGWEWWEK